MNTKTTASGPTWLSRIRSLLAFRHQNPVARFVSTLVAFAIASLLVVGTGAAYADDTPPAPTDTATAQPADPSTDAPATTPSDAPTDTSSTVSEPASTDPSPSAPASTSTSTSSTTATSPKTTSSFTKTSSISGALQTLSAAITVGCTGGPGDTSFGNFEIDGNLCTQGHEDWETQGVHVTDGLSDGTTFAGGVSEGDNPSTWALGGPTPNGKTDIETAWAYSKAADSTVYGFFALTNDSTSGGTSQYDLEYNQLDPVNGFPNRSAGDLLFRFSSTGSDPIQFTDAKKWTLKTDAAWSAAKCFAVTATSGWCTMNIPSGAFAQQVNSTGTFFEGAINIGLFFPGAGNCSGSFGSVMVRSVTGNSFYSSALKDYVAPLGVDTPSTCGRIIINKQDSGNTPLAGATFSVSPNPDPTQNPGDAYSITDNGPADLNSAAGIIEIAPVRPGVDYTVTETTAPTGYFLASPADQTKTVGASATVTYTFHDPKQWDALTASKTTHATYTAAYGWSISKEIAANPNGPWYDNTASNDPLVKTVGAGGSDTLYYRVTATEGSRTTSDFQVDGVISVGNTNSAAVTANISDTLPGATCTVEGDAVHNAAVPAGGADYNYVCTFAGTPASLSGTNTAHVTWAKGTYPQTLADVGAAGTYEVNPTKSYAFVETTSINKTVTITDDHHTFTPDPWQLTWSQEGLTHSQSYDRDLTVAAGQCASTDNTATLTGSTNLVLHDSAYGKVCEAGDLAISDVTVQTLVRTYPWTITKDTTTPNIRVVDGKATADYNMTVTAGAGADSAWAMSGTVTVDNPNAFEDVPVTSLTVDYTGANNETCGVTETLPVTVPKNGGEKVFHFSCTFPTQPIYTGSVDATIGWDGAAAGTPDSSNTDHTGVVDSDWSKTLVNDTVEVWDNHATADPSDDTKVADLTWDQVYNGDPSHQVVLPYSLDITTGLPALGACNVHTNVASVLGDNAVVLSHDDADVTVCNPYAQVAALKLDADTGLPLAGAEFTLSDQSGPLGTATSGADGKATFDNKLLEGTYTITETQAPAGYDLPAVADRSKQVVITSGDLTNDVEGQHAVLEPVTFNDPPQGALAIAKAHEERGAGGAWVPSDGKVAFGDQIKYVMTVSASGPKVFHGVDVTDYVPGYDPADTTTAPAGTKAELDLTSPTCSGDLTCTVSYDATTGLITWHLTGTGQPTGDVSAADTTGATKVIGTVEFVVRMPNIPATSPIKTPGTTFAADLANQADLVWTDAPEGGLTSNQVVDSATATLPPVVTPPKPPVVSPPSTLPNTGGPDAALLVAGLVLLLGGGTLVASDRRRKRRS